MKKKIIYILFLVVAFFGLNINIVSALNEKGTGGASGTTYSYGIKCFYYGEIISNSSYNPTAGGSIGSENKTTTPFVYGINFYCKNKKCKSFEAWGHGKAAHTNGGKYTVVGPNNYNALFMKGVEDNSNNRNVIYSFFGTSSGKGVSKCPDKLYYDKNKALIGSSSILMNTSDDGSKIGDWWYASIRGNFKYPQSFSLISSERYKKGSGGDLEKDVENLVKDFKEITTDASGNKYDTTSGAIGAAINNATNKNAELLEKIKNAAKSTDNNFKIKDTDISCEEILGKENVKLINEIFLIICVTGVVLVVILGSTDFVKAVASSDDDALAQAFKRLKNRIISVVILLLLPVLINFVLGFINGNAHFEIKNSSGKTKKIELKIGDIADCGK